MRLAALAVLSLLVASCAPRARTEVMLEVTADVVVRSRAVRLEVDVFGGPALDELREDGGLGSISQPVTFPARIALVPAGGDARRRYRVDLVALDASGVPLARHRVISGFVEGATLSLPVFLESCCADVACGDDETCRACACAPAAIDPGELEPLASDAGAPDAPLPDVGPVDASGPDASVDAAIPSLDAAGCAGGPCFVIDGFGSRSYVVSRLETWAPPIACGGALAPTSDHGYGWFVLYNERPRAYDLRLETQRWGAESASYDLALVAYALASPAEGDAPITARPADCLAMADGGGADPLDARLDVTIPAHGTMLVVVTTLQPGSIGVGNVQTLVSY
ncbi:MAG: hypothetical protein K1X94_19210 [Sandaracinaceae bacterium]|nr:hypothetical protein [Sandaracinaceae bacterium]